MILAFIHVHAENNKCFFNSSKRQYLSLLLSQALNIKYFFCADRRQKGRFAGFSLYVSNTTDRHDGYLCYKDGPELPPLDFNTNCTRHGQYVIFYNERLNVINYPSTYVTANVITELCEVTVTGMPM